MNFHTSHFSVLGSPHKFKIVKFLLKQEGFFSEREISRILNVSHMTVNRTMRELGDLHFIKSARIGRALTWTVIRTSYAFEAFSKMEILIAGMPDPLSDLKSTILSHLPLSGVREIVLFGSIAKGSERSGSDVDLFILAESAGAKIEILAAAEQLGLLCLDRFGNMLSPYILTLDEMKEKRNFKLLDEIDSGIILYKRLSVDDEKNKNPSRR